MKTLLSRIPLLFAGILFAGCEGIEPPYAVTTLEASKIGALEATLNGSYERSPLHPSYRVESAGFYLSLQPDAVKKGAQHQAKDVYSDESSAEFSVAITNLYAETTYYVVAYVVSDLEYYYGKEVEFETNDLMNTGTFTDSRDGRVYTWVTIGEQTWMAENLAWLPGSNPDKPENGSADDPFYYIYSNDGTLAAAGDDFYKTYGVLYNYRAAEGACPPGWRLPYDSDWEEMLGQFAYPEGGALKEAGTVHWDPPNQDAENYSEFTALPGGQRYYLGGFMRLRTHAYFWTHTPQDPRYYWVRTLESAHGRCIRGAFRVESGFSVRCIKE